MNKTEKKRRQGLVDTPHETQIIEIKPGITASVDTDMIPVIKWFNSYSTVTTCFCCQGNYLIKKDSIAHQPYCLFRCDDHHQLRKILKTFKAFGALRKYNYCLDIDVKVSYHEKYDVRYSARWYDRLALCDFSNFLQNNNLI